MMRRSIVRCLFGFSLLVSSACESADPAGALGPAAATITQQTKDYCERDPNCVHYADPDSAAPGIFAGLDLSWDGCVRGTPGIAGDSDLDAVDDYCEEVLADLFRPMLATSEADFASDSATTPGVLRVSTEGPAVRVLYLLSYHFDGGSPNPACPPSPGYNECAAHFGDSEFVELYLRYHRFKKHWLVAGALMSAHFQSGGVFEWAIDSSQWY